MSRIKPQYIVVRFGELWLRGRNRGNYINALRSDIQRRLRGENAKVESSHDRLLISLGPRASIERICSSLSFVFGISNYEVAYSTKPNLAAIKKLATQLMKDKLKEGSKSVYIDASRSYKELKFTSADIRRELIKTAYKVGISPEIENYDSEIKVNVTKELALLSSGKTAALGGLPVGTSGNGVVLLSGGIDSPVAAWYAMKRGIRPVYVHVHGFSDNKTAMRSKMSSLLRILSQYSPGCKAYFVPSHYFQVVGAKAGKFELVLLKAFMMRVAQRIAEEENADVIFTGESLGQVASQTASNMRAEQLGLSIPILRPLAGLDKQEIVSLARRIKTFDESVKEYRDVCSINARHPATRIRPATMEKLLDEIGIDRIVKRSLAASEVMKA